MVKMFFFGNHIISKQLLNVKFIYIHGRFVKNFFKMCNPIYIIIFVWQFSLLTVQADEDLVLNRDFSQENVEEPLKNDLKGGPFRFEFSSNAISLSKMQRGNAKRNFIKYTEFESNLVGVFYYNKEPKEAAFLSLGFEYVNIGLRHSFFRQKDFNNLSLALGGATKRFKNLLLRFQILSTINADHMNFRKYLSSDMLLWCRYAYLENMNFHFGLIGFTGMKMSSLWPLLGFDYRVNDFLKLNAIFPVNLSLVYGFDDYWSLALAARAVTSRNRLGKGELFSEGLYQYRSGGLELNLRYKNENCSNIEVHLHIGCTLFGRFKVSDKNHRHTRDFHLGTAPYIGGEISFRP